MRYSCTSGQGCDGFGVTDERARSVWFIRPERQFNYVKVDPRELDGVAGYYQLLMHRTKSGQLLSASPDYGRMTPMLARAVREYLPSIQEELNSLGSVLSVELHYLGIFNRTNDPLHLYWLDQEGGILRRGSVEPHRPRTLACYASEVFMLGRDESHPVAIYRAASGWTLGTAN